MPGLLKAREVARLFNVDGSTVRSWIKSGLLPSIKTPGGQYRIDPQAVERLLAEGPPEQPVEAVA